MTTFDDRSLLEDLLARSVDDWVSDAALIGIARRLTVSDPEAQRLLAIGLVAQVLVQGLMVAGDLDAVGHQPWECSPGDAVARVAEEWLARSNTPLAPGEVVWLDNTEAGRLIGEAVLARERRS